ncbi:MAG: YgiT-type zinc finger protein [Cyanobacteria bacterium NC_groundwater_1444_Ag_S-0.65um_54_12]|nr:YgiT-type zinc finger protein [Cyanobacteria bacterium NC_groundwater_1444_Ag_S-0.65um_54_12]
MTCTFCQGELERGTAPFSVSRRGYHVVWDAVPAWVCKQCGEPMFDDQEVDRIQRMIASLDRESTATA